MNPWMLQTLSELPWRAESTGYPIYEATFRRARDGELGAYDFERIVFSARDRRVVTTAILAPLTYDGDAHPAHFHERTID